MVRPSPHPSTLFSLVPLNERAQDVVAHPSNSYLLSKLPEDKVGLNIGYHIRSKSNNTLATLGRNDTDIIIEGSSIARFQCSFEINRDNNAVMLYDRSSSLTTQVSGENATPFERGRLRRVVVQAELNDVSLLGGVGCDLVKFGLSWHQSLTDATENIKSYKAQPHVQEENPHLARTEDEAVSVLPSQRVTSIHALREQDLKIRFMKVGSPLGSGQFGVVYKALDVDSGKLMAVKILQRQNKASEQREWQNLTQCVLRREVEILSRISHPHVVEYIASQCQGSSQIEIFMGLKEGTLESLADGKENLSTSTTNTVFLQMLQALDFLACNNIIHRDVKPANIPYMMQPGGQFQFQLGDFGLSTYATNAVTKCGSLAYMAPEIFNKGGQTPKADVWSLFVTMVWTLNLRDFRRKLARCEFFEDIHEEILLASAEKAALSIQEMARSDAAERSSAAQMLIKCYNGEGLTNPQSQVPALQSSLPPATMRLETPGLPPS